MKANFLKRAFYMALTAGLILTSCSDDNLPDDGLDGGKTDGKVGYISLALINSSISNGLKAEGSTHYGTANENKVNTVLIVLYDGDAPTSTVQYQFKLTGGTPSSPGDMASITPGTNSTTYKTNAQEVAKADYKLAVFINYPSALEGFTAEGKTLQAMLDAAEVSVDALTRRGGISSGNQDHFLMSNFAGLVDVPENKIYDNPSNAVNDPVDLYVERAVAKVTLTADVTELNNATGKVQATIGTVKWDLDVINLKTFWMRNPAPMLTAPFINGTVTGTTDEIATPSNRIHMYATDPNWNNFSHKNGAGSAVDLEKEFAYKSGTPTLSYDPTTNSNPANNDTYAYVTENTMPALEQWRDVTTSILISAVITPDETFFKEALTVGAEYFLYQNMVFTYQDIKDMYDVNTAGNTQVIASTSKTWAELIADGANADIVILPSILKSMEGSDGFGDYSAAPSESKDVVVNNRTVRFFAAGAPNYYSVPIRHFSDALQSVDWGYGRYGVVRNNWYNLTLDIIRNYGTATIPKDKPGPDDEDESWLSVRFEILPWIERTQGIEL